MAKHGRQIAELGRDVSHVLVFVLGHSQRSTQGLVQVGIALFPLVGVCELFHRAHDGRNAGDAIVAALEAARHVCVEVDEVDLLLYLSDFAQQRLVPAGCRKNFHGAAVRGNQPLVTFKRLF